MQEERMKILQMVADGKISADEAETLLRSLGSKQQQRQRQRRREHRHGPRPPRPPKPPKAPNMGQFAADIDNFTQGVERFVEGFVEGTVNNVVGGVAKAVRENVGSFANEFDQEFEDFDRAFDMSPTVIPIEPETSLDITNESGSLTFVSHDEPSLKITGAPKYQYHLNQKAGHIDLRNKRFGLDLTIHLPREVTQLSVRTEVSSIMALGLRQTPRDLQLKSEVGSIDVNLGTITTGRVLLKGEASRINLTLSEQSAVDVKASLGMGELDIRFPFNEVDQGPGYFSGSLNGGGAKVRVMSQHGEINIEPLVPLAADNSTTATDDDSDPPMKDS